MIPQYPAGGVLVVNHTQGARNRSAWPKAKPGHSGVISSFSETSVRTGEGSGPVGEFHVFETRRRKQLASERARWMAKAAEMGAVGDLGRHKYASDRVASLGRDLEPTVSRCGRKGRELRCGCKGTGTVWLRCKQHLVCAACNRARSKKLRAKMAAGLARALEDAREQWRREGCWQWGRPAIVLMTLTIKHSGDVARDRSELSDGWRKFYKRLHAHGWARPYCGVWEATSGRDGLGHVHMHVAIVWPWVCFSEVQRLWRLSCPRSKVIDLGAQKKGRRDGAPTTGKSAANYIGKYISKGADFSTMDQTLAADIVAASYNQRTVITSRRFWVAWERPPCTECGELACPFIAFKPWDDDAKRAHAAHAHAGFLERAEFLEDEDDWRYANFVDESGILDVSRFSRRKRWEQSAALDRALFLEDDYHLWTDRIADDSAACEARRLCDQLNVRTVN